VSVTPSPNIWRHPDLYERLNEAADPDALVLSALDELLAGTGRPDVALDVGCGTGFHLPLLAARASRVHGVEPHPGLAQRAHSRVHRARLHDRVSVHTAAADRLPLPDSSVDLVFSHWAYFFGPGCEPGLAEVDRVLRPGGLHVVVDVDTDTTDTTDTTGTAADHGYPRWLALSGSGVRADRAAAFFDSRGFRTRRLPVVWRFRSREQLAEVLRIEFPPAVAAQALAACPGPCLAVPTALRWRRRAAPDHLSDPPPTVAAWVDRRPCSGAPSAAG
jgi:SAM-dependent methyltransferase